jgi:hypothetical protein
MSLNPKPEPEPEPEPSTFNLYQRMHYFNKSQTNLENNGSIVDEKDVALEETQAQLQDALGRLARREKEEKLRLSQLVGELQHLKLWQVCAKSLSLALSLSRSLALSLSLSLSRSLSLSLSLSLALSLSLSLALSFSPSGWKVLCGWGECDR